MPALTPAEARTRADLITVTQYRVDLDVRGAENSEQSTFGSHTLITFTAADSGTTFVDVLADRVDEILLDGQELDARLLEAGRLPLDVSAGDHELTVSAQMGYSRDGQGLHRALDPADGATYLYGHLFLDAAPRVFACFDQPDLKAPFQINVRANPEWAVLSNGVIERSHGDRVEFGLTKPLATYFVTVCAGPYVSVSDEHQGIPLGVHARASLAAPLRSHAPDILKVTKGALDYFGDLFGVSYPFGSYDQVFVPEFNAGAMENPGCVTFRDGLLFRGVATSEDIMSRSLTVAHEAAHMWCGDMVTMRWWEDLWLNESFAEYLGHAALAHITNSSAPWVHGSISRKTWGYAAERAPSAHAVAATAPDTDAALANFDGISYAKGSAVLRQLIATVGEEVFASGMKDHIAQFGWGNASFADFIATMERASTRAHPQRGHHQIDIQEWARHWLREPGLDSLSVERSGDGVTVTRVGPDGVQSARSHLSTVAGWSEQGKVWEQELWFSPAGDTVSIAEPDAAVVLPNAADLTWARAGLDPVSLAALPRVLPKMDDPTHRAVVWSALIDSLAQAKITPQQLTDIVCAALPGEDEASLLTHVGRFVGNRLIPEYLLGDKEARERLSVMGHARWQRARSEGNLTVEAARLLVATTTRGNLLHRWRAGWELPPALTNDLDLRWLALRALAALGEVGRAEVVAESQRDDSLAGHLGALMTRAALPGAADKEWAWAQLVGPGMSNYERNALGQGFWLSGDQQLLESYVGRYLVEIPELASTMGPDALARLASMAFPRTLPQESITRIIEAHLVEKKMPAGVCRSMTDQLAVLKEVVRSRS